MFIDFSPALLIFWIFLTSFLPGAFLFLGLFKDEKRLNLLEKVLCGFAIGFIIPSFVPFLLFLFLGIKYDYALAIFSVVLFYIAAIAVFVKNKAYEELKGLKLPDLTSPTASSLAPTITAIFLVAILFLTFWIRIQSSSPIFYEFDPYFYLYSAQQILVLGMNPASDNTAWYPEVTSVHRSATTTAYMESIWYSVYTNNGGYSNYLLSLIGGYYPPIAAVFTVFFLYLFVSVNYRREYAALSAALVSFVPIFVMKFSSGEMEAQPYAFFTIAMFIAFYALAVQDKKIKFAFMAALAFAALSIGASSGVVVVTALLLFVPIYALVIFLRDNDSEKLKTFFTINAIILVFGFLFSSLALTLFHGGGILDMFGTNTKVYSLVTLASAALYIIKEKVKDTETLAYILLGSAIVALGLFAFTPLGGSIKDIASSTGFATYTTSLQRTIAEQGTAGGFFEGQLGYFGAALPKPFDALLIPLSVVTNTVFKTLFWATGYITGNQISYDDKPPSILLNFLALFFMSVAYGFYRFVKGEKNNALFYATLIIPIAVVAIVKAKFTIYLGILFIGLIGMVFGEIEKALSLLIKKLDLKEKELLKLPIYLPLIIGMGLVYAQYFTNNELTALVGNSLVPRFQDDPLALQNKFATLCSQLKLQGTNDEDVCAAANDPVGYASRGANYQYNEKLCVLSHYSNPFAPTDAENLAAGNRCHNMNDYWVETMDWIRNNTEQDSRTTSWWDYGHWINFFGQKNTVLRNEQSSLPMILEVAHDYIDGTPEDLIGFMKKHDSKYALFDAEILFSGNSFGGKYGALNYLSCARDNDTNVSLSPGQSYCESDHLWEIVYIPSQNQEGCQITKNATGIVSYKVGYSQTANGLVQESRKAYCIGETTLSDGRKTTATFYLDRKYDNGDLKLNKAFLKPEGQTSDGFKAFTLLYSEDKLWVENGEVKSGYEDRKGKFYDSNLYKAFVLENLPGFDLVFKSKGGQVKIYKLRE